jgi:phosphatidyl-myo-inositol alpha-mannosyltransferase
MRILQVGTGFASLPPTGAYATERTIHFLSGAMAALGHEVTVLDVEDKNRPSVPYRIEEVPLRWRRDSNLLTHTIRGIAFSRAILNNLQELSGQQKFDVVNFNNQFSAWHIPLLLKYNLPAVYSLHNALWYDSNACRSAWQKLKFFQDLRAMRLANVVICQNNTTGQNLEKILNIAHQKIAVVPLGIADNWFKITNVSEKIRRQFSPAGEPLILHVARIAPYKNQITLVRAMEIIVKKVPDARLLFVGPISDRHYYQELKGTIAGARLASHIIFTGELPHADLPEIYSLSSVFACPSVMEAFGVVIMEAMAQGKAVVASNIETFRELLGEARGITVPVFDHEAMANAIITSLNNKLMREEMGQKAKEYVKANYTWEKVAKKTIEVYSGITNDTGQ